MTHLAALARNHVAHLAGAFLNYALWKMHRIRPDLEP